MMSQDQPIKAWSRLLDAGKKVTNHPQTDENRAYPLRRAFRPVAPDIAKASLKRDFEQGLVYYVGDEQENDRALCGLDRLPPTGRSYKGAIEKKRIILDDAGVFKKMAFDKKKGTFQY
jgi:heterodisulfide reductase subunit C